MSTRCEYSLLLKLLKIKKSIRSEYSSIRYSRTCEYSHFLSTRYQSIVIATSLYVANKGIMTNLLTDMHGKKISKSSLENSIISNQSPSLGDPFKLYQYLMNTPDELAKKFLNSLTFYNENKISQILNSHLNNKSLKVAQKALSSFVIDVVHGKKVLAQIEKLVNILFILKQCNFERLHDDEKNIAIKYLPKAFYDPKKTIGENLEEIIDDKSLLNSNFD